MFLMNLYKFRFCLIQPRSIQIYWGPFHVVPYNKRHETKKSTGFHVFALSSSRCGCADDVLLHDVFAFNLERRCLKLFGRNVIHWKTPPAHHAGLAARIQPSIWSDVV